MTVVPPGQAAELLLFGTPDEWVSALQDLQDQIYDGVDMAIDSVSARINSLSATDLAMLGLGGGPVGLGIALDLTVAKHFLLDRLDSCAHQINDKLDELWEAVQAAVDGLYGNPAKLMELGAGYATAKTFLDGAIFDINREHEQLARYWQGHAFDAYAHTAQAQVEAMSALGPKLEGAANLIAEAANAIRQAWSAIVEALLSLASSIVDKVASGLDLGAVLAGETKPALGVVASAIDLINDCSAAVRKMNSAGETHDTMSWKILADGSSAFENGRDWPSITPESSADYTDPDQWRP